MAYKTHLFETGGYAAYAYELARGEKDNDKQEQLFADYHNNLRDAGATIVGLAFGAVNMFNKGAKQIMGESRSAPNWSAINQAAGWQEDRPDYIATTFGRVPFVGIRKDGNDGLILQSRPIDITTAINPFDDEQERLLKKLFPGYAHPKDYKKAGTGTRFTPVFSFADTGLEGTISGETLHKLMTGEFSPFISPLITGSPEFASIKKLPKGMAISFTMRLRVNNAEVTNMGYTASSEGAIPTSSAVKVSVQLIPELHLPTEYGHWCLYCEDKSEFVPYMFMTHINSIVRAASGATDDKAAATFIGEMGRKAAAAFKKAKPRKPTPMSMARRNKNKEKATGYVPAIRTNADGYLITANNHIMKLPTEGKMGEYQAASNDWFEKLSDIEVSKMADGGRDAPKFRFKPSVLYIDNHNEVMVFTNLEGAVTSLNLRGARPLDDITIAKHYPQALRAVLNGHAFEWTDERFNALGFNGKLFFNLVQKLARMEGNEAAVHYVALGANMAADSKNPLMHSFEDWAFVTSAARDAGGYGSEETNRVATLVNTVRDGTDDEHEQAVLEIIKMLKDGASKVALVARKVWAENKPKDEDAAVIGNLEADAEAYIVGVHTDKVGDYNAKRVENERDNIVDSLDRNKPVALPNIDTERFGFLFPHQGQFVQKVNDLMPHAVVLGAAPGGGKTNCIMADILLLLQAQKIKRPVVVVPNNLVRQFCNEINEFTNGKINAFPLTFQHVREVMMNPYGLNMNFAEMVKYLRDLPRNTIIVTNYNTLKNEHTDAELKASYEQVNSYDNFGSARPLRAYPFVDMLAAAGMDYVCGDESHKIKNDDSGLSQAFLCLCAKAEYVRLSSGTTINNVVTDLVGQTKKINPAILGGNVEKFAEAFLGSKSTKQITDPIQADAVMAAMREYALVMQKDSRSWDYMLPQMQEVYHRVSLTETQTRYYNVLFEKAINLIQEDSKLKGAFAAIDKAEGGGDDSGRRRRKAAGEEDNGQIAENEEKANNKIERIVKKHFSIIDRFINDPTQFPDFVDGSFVYDEYMMLNNGDEAEPGSLPPAKITDEDLVSVKAKRAYELMYAHVNEKGMLDYIRNGPEGDGDPENGAIPNWQSDVTNKVIVMAPNRFVGNHVWANLPADLKRRAVRYQAGSFNKVEQFKEDPNIKFMIADEISISEGHNLQVGSRIIRLQQVWTPGGETQSLARIRRPDPFGKYNRASLGYDIIVATRPNGAPTIDDLRIARLLAKKFNNAMVEFGFEPSFRNKFMRGGGDPLPPIRMSMKNIKFFDQDLLNLYFKQQKDFNAWFRESALAETKKIGQEVEALTGQKLLDEAGRPLDVKAFVQAVVVRTQQAPDIPGTASCYVPWIPGVQPINPLGFDMQPIRSVTSVPADDEESYDEDDEDAKRKEEEEEEDANDALDNVEVKPGDYVMTEFGPGQVEKALRASKKSGSIRLQIIIPGMKDPRTNKPMRVRLNKTCVYVPVDEAGYKTLANAVKGKAGGPVRPPTKRPISAQQRDEAKDRRTGSKKPAPEFIDYDEDDDFEADDFDLVDLEDDLLEDEPEDPIDTLIAEEDEDADFEDDEDEEEEEGNEPTIYASAIAINGQLAVIADDTSDDKTLLNTMYTKFGFHAFPDMARVEFTTRKSLEAFLARVAAKKYVIPRNLMEELMTVAEGLTSRGKLRQIEPFDYTEVTNFMRTEQRKVPTKVNGGPQTFRLYPLVTNGKFYLCASISKHPFNVKGILSRLAQGIPGAGKVQVRDNMGVKFYKSLSEAKRDAKKLIADGTLIMEPQDFIDSFDSIQGGHIDMPAITKPKTTTVKETDNTPKPVPGAKPALKPGKTKVSKTDRDPPRYSEESHNPDVEDMDEFKQFVSARRATMTLIKGGDDDLRGIPLRVRRTSLKSGTFTVSPYEGAPDSEWIRFNFPDTAKFNNKAATMTIGRSVWRLSYAAG